MEEFIQEMEAGALLAKYGTMVYRLAYARTGNVQDAEDITQEVFLKYIKEKKLFHDEEHRKAWLLTVTANTGKNLVTNAWNRHRASIENVQDAITSQEGEQAHVYRQPNESDYVMMEEPSELRMAMNQLPEKYSKVVHLFYFEELSVIEIANMLHEKETTIKSQLHRARNMLKELLKEGNYEF